MRRTLLLVLAAAVLGGLGVGVIQITTASAISEAESFTVVAPDTDLTELDFNRAQGGKRGPSQGDQLIFSGPILPQAGSTTSLGRIDGVCTTRARRGTAPSRTAASAS